MKSRQYLFPLSLFLVFLLALVVSEFLPAYDTSLEDPLVTWTVPALATDTPTPTKTPGWYHELPTPSYPTRTIAPSETPTLTTTVGSGR